MWVISVKLLKRKRWFTFKGKPKAHHLDVINNLTTAWSPDSAVCMFIPGSLLCIPCLYMFRCTNWCSQYISVHLKFSVLMGHFMSVPSFPFMALHELRAAYSSPLLGLLWGLNGLIYTMHLILCPAHGKYTINIFYYYPSQKLANFMWLKKMKNCGLCFAFKWQLFEYFWQFCHMSDTLIFPSWEVEGHRPTSISIPTLLQQSAIM